MIQRVPTTIVSGFPGIGKSTYAKMFPTAVRDLESSDFHWIQDSETGEKIPNPEWPKNYIEAIRNLDKSGVYRKVFVSSHDTVLKEIAAAKIKYSIIFPENTKEMKDIMMTRYKDRGSPESFIENMDQKWDEYLESIRTNTDAIAKVALTPSTLDDWGTWCIFG